MAHPEQSDTPPYKAFISYSHAADGKLAPALEKALERFAKPWNRARAFDVFRDESDLGLNPSLWASVREALSQSEFFILMASPEGAASNWIAREVNFWKEHGSPDKLLLVLTEGEIAWDEAAGDFDWDRTTALPRAVEGIFTEEPLYLDLRWARTEDHLGLDHARFREAIADVAATLHGVPKADLESEEVRQARKTRRLARGAIAGLSLLLISMLIGAWLARVAEERARIATSREFAAQAIRSLSRDPLEGLVIAIRAATQAETLESQDALRQALLAPRVHLLVRSGSGAFSPDGQRLLLSSPDKVVRVLDIESGEEVTRWQIGSGDSRIAPQFSPDGALVMASSSNRAVGLWETESGKPLDLFLSRPSQVQYAWFRPDGRQIVTVARDGAARVWDAQSGQQILVLRGPEDGAWISWISADGQRLAARDWETVQIWDAQSGTVMHVLQHGSQVTAIDFSPNGRLVVIAGSDGIAHIWEVSSGRRTTTLRAHKGSFEAGGGTFGDIRHVAFSPDGGRVVTSSSDLTARIWDVEPGSAIAVLDGHDGVVNFAGFSPDGQRVVTASNDRTARVWNAASGRELAVLSGFEGFVESARYSQDGRWVAVASADGSMRVWSASLAPEIDGVRVPPSLSFGLIHSQGQVDSAGSLSTYAIGPEARLVATATHGGTVRIWDLSSGQEPLFMLATDGRIWTATFSPDGERLLTGGDDGTVQIWDVESGREIAKHRRHAGFVTAAAFSPGGRMVATGGGELGRDTVILWDLPTGRVVAELPHNGLVFDISFSPDGRRIATAAEFTGVRLWDVSSGAPVADLTDQEQPTHVKFSADGQRVITIHTDRIARVWDADTGALSCAVQADGGYI